MRALCLTLVALSSCRDGSEDARHVQLRYTAGFAAQLEAEAGLAPLVAQLSRDPGQRWLDLGDLLPPDADLEFARRLARHLGPHALALNLGPHEVRQADLLQRLRREGALPWLSANARPIDEWSLARSFIRSVDGVRMGITGVVLPESAASEDFVLLEHGPALANEIHALQSAGAEVLILLARMERDEAEVLAEVAPQLDFIIYGAESSQVSAPARCGDTWLLHGGAGRAVGRLRLSVRAPQAAFRLGEDGEGHPNRFWLDLRPVEEPVR